MQVYFPSLPLPTKSDFTKIGTNVCTRCSRKTFLHFFPQWGDRWGNNSLYYGIFNSSHYQVTSFPLFMAPVSPANPLSKPISTKIGSNVYKSFPPVCTSNIFVCTLFLVVRLQYETNRRKIFKSFFMMINYHIHQGKIIIIRERCLY